MKCSKCQTDMFQAKDSWLCMECGHLETTPVESVPLEISKKKVLKVASPSIAPPPEPVATPTTPPVKVETIQPPVSSVAPLDSPVVTHTIDHSTQTSIVVEAPAPIESPTVTTITDSSSTIVDEVASEEPSVATSTVVDNASETRVPAPSAADLHPAKAKSRLTIEPPTAMSETTDEKPEVTPVPVIAPAVATSEMSAPPAAEIVPATTVTEKLPESPPRAIAQDLPAPSSELKMVAPVTHPKPMSKKVKIGAIIALISALLLGGGSVYAFAVAPQNALPDYIGRLYLAKTSHVVGSVKSGDADAAANFEYSGDYDITNIDNPKASLAISGQFGGSATGSKDESSIKADVINTDKTIYVKLSDAGFLQLFLPTITSNSWMKYDYSKAKEAKKDPACSKPTSTSKPVFGSQVLSKIPVKNASFKGFGTVDGQLSSHFVGEIDLPKMKALIDTANKSLPESCRISSAGLGSPKDKIVYEVWRGISSDKLIVTSTSDSKDFVVKLTTSSYNKKVSIVAPKDAVDLSKLFSGEGSGSQIDAPDPAPLLSASDIQRQADLRSIQKGLEEYFIDNKKYPNSLITLTKGSAPPLAKIPLDPNNTSPFKYTYTIATNQLTYTLTACLESATVTGSNIEAPIAPCATKSYVLKQNS